MDLQKAEYFLSARQRCEIQQTPQFQAWIPTNLAEAYSIQHHNFSHLGQPKGWKLGGTTSLTQTLFDTRATYYGPIFESSIFEATDAIKLPVGINNPKGEAEVCFELSDKVLELFNTNINQNNIGEFIVNIMPCLELPWSVFPLPAAGMNILIADQCGTGALIYGDKLPYSSTCFNSLTGKVSVISKSKILAEGEIENILAGPLSALTDFLKLAKSHQLQVQPGDIVATGGCTSCIELPFNRKIIVNMSILGEFSFALK